MDFWDHLEEFRKVLLRSLLIIAIGFACSLFFYTQLFELLTLPVHKLPSHETLLFSAENQGSKSLNVYIPIGSHILHAESLSNKRELGSVTLAPGEKIAWEEPQNGPKLALLSPTEGLSTMLKLSLWVSVLCTSPFWLFLMARFIAPGLQNKEKRLLLPFILLSILLLSLGAGFAYFFTLPIANEFLLKLNANIASNLWSLSHYLNYTLIILFGNALAFESLAILLLMIHKGWVKSSSLIHKRRHVIVGIFIASAILTPPDVITQTMLALPMWLFFECSILYAKQKERKLRRGFRDF